MKRILFALLAALALVAPAAAQVYVVPEKSFGVSDAVSAVSTDVGIYVKYIGTASGVHTVAVDAATGDLAFVVSGVADTGINQVTGGVGLCGNTAGTIDVSDADCNTFGEVIDVINGSTNWIAWPGAVLRTDSANNTLDTLAAADAHNGLALLKDTAVALNVTLDVRPGTRADVTRVFTGSPGAPYGLSVGNPFAGYQTLLYSASENVTCAGGAIGTFSVFGVSQTARPRVAKAAGAVAPAVSYTETVRTIWAQAGAACTNVGSITIPLLSQPGERVLVRVTSTVTLTVPLVYATGAFYEGVALP